MAYTPTSAPKKPNENNGKSSEAIGPRPEVSDAGYGTYYKGN